MPRRKQDAKEAERLAARIGARAREARAARGVTQEEVAEEIGISAEALGRIERGWHTPSFPTFTRLCAVLRLAPNDLLGDMPPALSSRAAEGTPGDTREARELRRLVDRLEARDQRVLVAMARALARHAERPKRRQRGR